jgi:hypothetical protein
MKRLILILILVVSVFAADNFVNDSTYVTIVGNASDTVFVQFKAGYSYKMRMLTSWSYRSDLAISDGDVNTVFYHYPMSGAHVATTLAVQVNPVDEHGNAFKSPVCYLDFDDNAFDGAQFDTTSVANSIDSAEVYSATLGGFTGKCYGYRFILTQTSSDTAGWGVKTIN